MATLQSISDKQILAPSPLCPRCSTSTLRWYTDAPQTKGERVQIGGPVEIGYRCNECFLFVAIPYSTGPVYRRP